MPSPLDRVRGAEWQENCGQTRRVSGRLHTREVREAGQPETIKAEAEGKSVVGPRGMGCMRKSQGRMGKTVPAAWLQGMRDRGE